MSSLLRSSLLLLAAGLAMPGIVLAQPHDYPAGISLFEADPSLCYVDFSLDPLPPDFFGPGSDPFTGFVALRGEPVAELPACPTTNLLGVHAVMERQGDIVLPEVGSSVVIPIEMLSMELVSVEPITVTFGGGKRAQLYDVKVHPATPAPGDDFSRMDFEAAPAEEILTFGVTYNNPSGLFPNTFLVTYYEVVSHELVGIMKEVAADIPLAVVRKDVGGKESSSAAGKAACDANFCMNEEHPLLFVAPGFQIGLMGVCEQGPVRTDERSWGATKAAFDDSR